MSSLYRTAYYVDMRSIPTWYEQKRPRTYLIGDDSFRRSTRRSFAPLQKPPRNLQHFIVNKSPIRYGFAQVHIRLVIFTSSKST